MEEVGVARLLVVEDHDDVRAMLVEHLAGEGHDVLQANDGREALATIEAWDPDLVVLDLMLPRLDGSGVLRAIRECSTLPVVVVSARDAVWNRIDLLRLGADDYLTKPFDLGELSARIDTVLRRTMPAGQDDALRHGPLALDVNRATASVDGVELELTVTELRILSALMQRPGTVLSRAVLYEQAWQEPFLGDDATVKAHVSNLRAKLRRAGAPDDLLQTVWGMGYRLARHP